MRHALLSLLLLFPAPLLAQITVTANPAVLTPPMGMTTITITDPGPYSQSNGTVFTVSDDEADNTIVIHNGTGSTQIPVYLQYNQVPYVIVYTSTSFQQDGPIETPVYFNLPGGSGRNEFHGQYTFFLDATTGMSGQGSPGRAIEAGTLQADGMGNITGELDVNGDFGSYQKLAVTGTSNISYTGKGTLTLTTSKATQHFDIFLTFNPEEAGVLVATDPDMLFGTGVILPRGLATNSNNPNAIQGTYALRLAGENPCGACTNSSAPLPVTAGGLLTVGSGGSLTCMLDQTSGSTVFQNISVTGALGAQDTFGRFLLTATMPNEASSEPQHFVGYAVDDTKFFLLSSDPHTSTILMGGEAQDPPYISASAPETAPTTKP